MKVWKVSIIASFAILFAILIYSSQLKPTISVDDIRDTWIGSDEYYIYPGEPYIWNGTSGRWEIPDPDAPIDAPIIIWFSISLMNDTDNFYAPSINFTWNATSARWEAP